MENAIKTIKTSCIITVYNEEETIILLLHSLFHQSIMPNEIIIVDAGSTDRTLQRIRNFEFGNWKKKHTTKLKIFVQNGNRAVGRNYAIKKTTGNIILCIDAGCYLDKDWVKHILAPFTNTAVDVVAGFYRGESKNIFQECLIPYVLIMPDQVDEKSFLPSSRSMAFKKSIWKKLDGFPEQFDRNEDYVFAKRLQKAHANIVFAKNAIVYWFPRENLSKAFWMFFHFAAGDAQAKIFRPKVILLFIRYILGIVFFIAFLLTKNYVLLYFVYSLVVLYIVWAIIKNFRYIGAWQAFLLLPVIQFTADIAVLLGTVNGLVKHQAQ